MKSGIEPTDAAASSDACSLSTGRHALGPIRAVMRASTRADRAQHLASAIRFGRDIACAPRFDHGLDRPHDADIAGAAAQIAAQSDADQTLVGLRQPQHEIARGDQHSRRAVAALQGMLAGEGRTKLRCHRVLVEAFDRGDLRPFAGNGIGDARARRHAVEQHGARAADAVFTAEMRTGQIEFVADEVRKVGTRFRRYLHGALVHGECDHAHAAASRTARFSTLT